MKTLLFTLKILVVLAVIVGGYFGLRELAVPEVTVARAYRGTATLSATGNVTVLTAAEASVKAPAQGKLLRFGVKEGDAYRNFKEGDIVEENQIIGQIDPGQLPFQLRQAEAELEHLEARRKVTTARAHELARRKDLLEKGREMLKINAIAADEIRNRETSVAALETDIFLEELGLDHAIRRAQVNVEQLKDQLERFTMRAPFRGILMAPNFMEGDLVFAGNAITKITSTNKLIKAEINQDDLPAVRDSKRVVVNFFSFPNANYEGRLQTLVEIGNSTTQRFTAFVKMTTLPDKLLVGQTGEASFIADEHRNALLIPASALVGDNAVFVFDPQTSRIKKRPVKTGHTAITTVEILDGLSDGDLVVSCDIELQRDNNRVRLRE